MSPLRAGMTLVAIIAVACYFGFTKKNPFSNPFELNANFQSANDIKAGSPVRIAGVNVGEVKKVEPLPNSGGDGAAIVKMTIQRKGLPIHDDAELKIRPRIFLEGNFFVDIRPGSPSAPLFESGDTVPVNQTATPVQFGQVLTALQSDTREDLQTFLREYSTGLNGGGAQAFNRSIPYWEPAYRSTSLVNEATLGTQVGDLRRMIRGQAKTLRALSENEQALKDLISNFNTTAAAFAREDDALEAAIPELRDVLQKGQPALRSLNSSLPSLSAFARDALPGTRSSLPTINASLPFVRQLRLLFSEPELKGLTRDLRPTVPALARLNAESVPLLEQQRLLSSCQNNVLLPFSTEPIPNPDERNEDNPDADNDGEPFYKQAPRGTVGLSGESRITDANGPMFRVQLSGGNNTVFEPGSFQDQEPGPVFGQTAFDVEGARPAKPSGELPRHRPDVPCETQVAPNLEAPLGGPPTQQRFDFTGPIPSASITAAATELAELLDHQQRVRKGLPSVDPLQGTERDERIAIEQLGLERGPDHRLREKSAAGTGEGAE